MIKVIGLNTKVLKKEPFSGSHHGMRFFMRAEMTFCTYGCIRNHGASNRLLMM